ncbi:hypothetical protein HMPREF9151_02015 [Hoylesella saccharolytica F0055]|uniref:Uncharacterized protein n=1 Tax=Hoylesella saccharolytica F0055 TaxID=1127699 RepID=L1N599_9BACT|nr:hypothetical protein HMPREF9151_02015 [Hoylesella saccharolytica F0055]
MALLRSTFRFLDNGKTYDLKLFTIISNFLSCKIITDETRCSIPASKHAVLIN